MKMFEEVITKIYFLWYGVATFSQNYLKQTQKMKKLLNQFNNFYYLTRSLHWKCKISLKLVTKENTWNVRQNLIRSPFRHWNLLKQFNNFGHPNNLPKPNVYCLQLYLKLLKKHITVTKLHKKTGNTKLIKSIQ